MPYFKPLSNDQELLGILVKTYPSAINYDNFKEIYAKHGLDNVDPNKWYPAQSIANVVNEIADVQTGAMFDFVSIGIAMIDELPIPGIGQLSFVDIMKGLDAVLQQTNRGSDTGYVKVEEVSDKHLKIHIRSIAPDDVVYGSYYALARKSLAKGTSFTVFYDPDAPRRDDGAQETIIHIKWD
jgi:hypothetical protein